MNMLLCPGQRALANIAGNDPRTDPPADQLDGGVAVIGADVRRRPSAPGQRQNALQTPG